MNIFILMVSLAVYTGCVQSTDIPTDDLSRLLLDCLMKKLAERTTPLPISSTPAEKLSDTSKDTSDADNLENPEELFTKLLQEFGQETKGSSQLSSSHEPTTPSYLSTLPLTTSSTLSPLSVLLGSTKPPPSPLNNNEGLPLASSKPQAGSYFHPPSNGFQYPQPSVPKQYELPSAPQHQESIAPFLYIPQEVPHPYNQRVYDSIDWKSPVISPQNENYPYNPPSQIPDEINPILYQSPLIPIGPAEQPSHFPQVYNEPQMNYSPFTFSSSNEVSQTKSGSSQFVNNLLQQYGIPGHVVSSYVRTSTPQDQFHPLQFQVHRPSLQPSGYVPLPHQIPEEDILSLIQSYHASSLPSISSPPSNPHYFTSSSAQSYSNHPNFASAPSNSEKVSGTFSSSPVKEVEPFSFYREPRTPITL